MLFFEQTQNKGQMLLCQTTHPVTKFGTLSICDILCVVGVMWVFVPIWFQWLFKTVIFSANIWETDQVDWCLSSENAKYTR